MLDSRPSTCVLGWGGQRQECQRKCRLYPFCYFIRSMYYWMILPLLLIHVSMKRDINQCHILDFLYILIDFSSWEKDSIFWIINLGEEIGHVWLSPLLSPSLLWTYLILGTHTLPCFMSFNEFHGSSPNILGRKPVVDQHDLTLSDYACINRVKY